MKPENYYAILGIRIDADEVVIAAAYRALAKKHHPDTGGSKGTENAAKFRLVQEAFDVLRDPAKRRQYNTKLASQRGRRYQLGDNKSEDSKKADSRSKGKRAAAPNADASSPIKPSYKFRKPGLWLAGLSLSVGTVVGTIGWNYYSAENVSPYHLIKHSKYQTTNISSLPVKPNSDPVVVSGEKGNGNSFGNEQAKGDLLQSNVAEGSSKKTYSRLPQAATDFFERDIPYINTSDKEDLSPEAPQLAEYPKCKLYSDRIEGDHVVPGGTEYLDVGCLKNGKLIKSKTAPSQESENTHHVQMVKEGGTYTVPVLINDVLVLHFVVDSGAADVTIPADVAMTLNRTGTIRPNDFIGSRKYQLADGSVIDSAQFIIRSLKVGDQIVENVRGSIGDAKGSLLLGQSFLEKFKSWSMDNASHELVLE